MQPLLFFPCHQNSLTFRPSQGFIRMARTNLLEINDCGIYCPKADIYIDPWKPVERALITHAHSDHARWGNRYYLAHHDSESILKLRLGHDINLETTAYGQEHLINGVKVSFHPAGHITGSAQIRLEYKGEVWVVSGDFKTEPDVTCAPFEPIRCHTFITESTFGMPVYNWNSQEEIFNEINDWWKENAEQGKASLLVGYALGKAQRLLANVDAGIGKIFVHGAVDNVNKALERSLPGLPPTTLVSNEIPKKEFAGSLIVAPPSALNTPWTRKFAPYNTAMASGWMNIRGTKRRRAVDKGFVLSDHADWKGLNWAVKQTGCERVLVTHGYTAVFSKWLREQGYDAEEVHTLFNEELEEVNKE